MTAITIANKEWDVISDLSDALTDATLSGVTIFKQVHTTTSAEYAKGGEFTGSAPIAWVIFENRTENEGPENVLWCQVSVTIMVAWQDKDADTDAEKLENILYYINAAINAIQADPPDDASAGGDTDHYQRALEWGEPELDLTEKDPWAVATIPLTVGFVLNGHTAH